MLDRLPRSFFFIMEVTTHNDKAAESSRQVANEYPVKSTRSWADTSSRCTIGGYRMEQTIQHSPADRTTQDDRI